MNPQPDTANSYRSSGGSQFYGEEIPRTRLMQVEAMQADPKANPAVDPSEENSEFTGYAATLEIDVSPHELEALTPQACPATPLHYVQGVLQGQYAYLITNLLDGESQTLLQPQMIWTIGRNRHLALPLPDKGLSRRHAVIQYVRRQGFYLIDLESMNGCYVNTVRIRQAHLLADGDLVQLAHTTFTFFLSSGYKNLDPVQPDELAQLHGLIPTNSLTT